MGKDILALNSSADDAALPGQLALVPELFLDHAQT
jgi:hypothetical protein